MTRWVCYALLLGLTSGCYRVTIRNGAPPGEVPRGFEQRWHSGWFFGALESSGPHDLATACPEGWAVVETRGHTVTAIVTATTSLVYAPHTVTLVCARTDSTAHPSAPRPTATTYPQPREAEVLPPPRWP